MKNLTTLGTAAFESKKQEAIRNEVMRKELNLSEFNVIDNIFSPTKNRERFIRQIIISVPQLQE